MQDSTITMSNLRADRLATLYFFRPLHRIVSGGAHRRIPILMYHSISETAEVNTHPYFQTETSPLMFEAHMKYLRDNQYTVIFPEDVVKLLSSNHSDETKYAVITFDDGYRDFYANAFPILKKYGMSATVYLPTAFIRSQPEPFKGKNCMTWNEVRELQREGVRFGSHTVTHPVLRFLPGAELEREIRCSKETLENELSAPVPSFAYPFAFPEEDRAFTRRLRDLLEECGYENGVSTVIGSVHALEDKFFLKRLPANSWDDPALLQAKLEGDYDWLRRPQYLKKWIQKRSEQPNNPTGSSN